jgi:hypothetical protein
MALPHNRETGAVNQAAILGHSSSGLAVDGCPDFETNRIWYALQFILLATTINVIRTKICLNHLY